MKRSKVFAFVLDLVNLADLDGKSKPSWQFYILVEVILTNMWWTNKIC